MKKIELKKPTIVSGKEHFFTAHENISCFASPIINYDGKTIGIIDASTDYMSREQHTLALVKLATRSIETKLFLKKFEFEYVYENDMFECVYLKKKHYQEYYI